MDWLFRTEFDALTTIALWSIAGVLVATVTLLVYTIGLRVATVAAERRRRAFVNRWRDVFALSVMSADAARDAQLPKLRRGDRTDLLEEWNRSCSMVEGDAVRNLVTLAERTHIPELATKLFHRRRVSSRILAVQTFGHLRTASMRDRIRDLVDDSNTALSITAAAALVDIDPDFGVSVMVPLINERRPGAGWSTPVSAASPGAR